MVKSRQVLENKNHSLEESRDVFFSFLGQFFPQLPLIFFDYIFLFVRFLHKPVFQQPDKEKQHLTL